MELMRGKIQRVDMDASLTEIAEALMLQTKEQVEPTTESIFECFKKHCHQPECAPFIWDDQFIIAFELTQDFLIEEGLIESEHCMRI